MPENRDGAGRFAPGVSGNPGGRKRLPKEFKDVCKKSAMDALRVLIAIMESPASEPAQRVAAAKIIIERAYGKPAQEVSASLSMGGDFVLEIVPPEDELGIRD